MIQKLTVLVVALTLAACDAPTAVQPHLSATYGLVRVNGRHLPTVVAEGGGNRYTLLADTLQFMPDGNVRRTSLIRWVTTEPVVSDTTYTQQFTLPYVVDGRTVIMGYRTPCPPNANCVGSEQGDIDSETLRLTARMLWPGEPQFVFRRVP